MELSVFYLKACRIYNHVQTICIIRSYRVDSHQTHNMFISTENHFFFRYNLSEPRLIIQLYLKTSPTTPHHLTPLLHPQTTPLSTNSDQSNTLKQRNRPRRTPNPSLNMQRRTRQEKAISSFLLTLLTQLLHIPHFANRRPPMH